MKTILIATFLSACLYAPLSFACTEQPHTPGEKYAKMADDLKFTPEQREKLKKIQDEYHKTLPGKHQAMDAAHDELEAALTGSANKDQVRKKFEELQIKQNEFAAARFEKILSIRDLLTPEQRKMFNAFDDKGKTEKK
jgi:Spy/CpxP family protein refolding chaperone